MSMNGVLIAISPLLLSQLQEGQYQVSDLLRLNETALPRSPAERAGGILRARMQDIGADTELMAAAQAQLEQTMAKLSQSEMNALLAGQSHLSSARSASSVPVEHVFARLALDKAWHGVSHVLRTKGHDPIFGGAPVGEDLGYGPARCLTSTQVRDLAAALDAIDEAQIMRRFDPEELNSSDIYPGGWTSEPDTTDWLLQAAHEVRAFYREAAEKGRAVLACIT